MLNAGIQLTALTICTEPPRVGVAGVPVEGGEEQQRKQERDERVDQRRPADGVADLGEQHHDAPAVGRKIRIVSSQLFRKSMIVACC